MTRTDPRLIWLAAGAFVVAILGANAHLAYVAFTSQPDCVAHVGPGEAAPAAQFSAAKSSC